MLVEKNQRTLSLYLQIEIRVNKLYLDLEIPVRYILKTDMACCYLGIMTAPQLYTALNDVASVKLVCTVAIDAASSLDNG